MARAFLPANAHTSDKRSSFTPPPLRLAWKGARFSEADLALLRRLTGLTNESALQLLFPHVLGFRLLMALLTERAFPLPIWKALQIRNRLRSHRPVEPGASVDLQTRVAASRVLEKGVEVDLHTRIQTHGGVAWESVVTFYYRGRYGAAGEPAAESRPPQVYGEEIAHWRAAGGSNWTFGRLTGDFNGIHWSDRYARAFGFRGAFHHPQRVLGQCLAHLGDRIEPGPAGLDAWLRGPVLYDAELSLRARAGPQGLVFGVFPEHDARPAVIGRLGAQGGERALVQRGE